MVICKFVNTPHPPSIEVNGYLHKIGVRSEKGIERWVLE